MFAAVNFGVWAPGFFSIAAGLLDYVLGIEPALQMAATEFPLFVLLVAGALPGLFDLYFMMRKLRGSLRARSRDFTSCHRLTFVARRERRRIRSLVLRASLYAKRKGENPRPRYRMLALTGAMRDSPFEFRNRTPKPL